MQPAFDLAASIAASRFDSSSATQTFVVRSAGGKYVTMSASAVRLLALRQQGLAPAAIAEQLSSGADQPYVAGDIEAGLARLDAQFAAVDAAPLSSGFLFEMPLLPAVIVRPIARKLAPLFQAWVAALLASSAVAIIAWLFVSRGVPAVNLEEVWPAFGLSLATLLVHEFGHAAACARFGAPPSAIGFTIYVVYPAFYCDVTAAWTLSRRQRLAVDAGGFYFQAIAIAALAMTYVATGWTPLHLAAWMSLGTFALSLNPMFKFDGYWLAADALGVANLAAERGRILRHYWCRLRGRVAQALPYPRGIRILLAPYAVTSFTFFGWFLVTAVPPLSTHLVRYPDVLMEMVAGIARRGAPSTTAILSFLAATMIALLAVLLFRRLLLYLIAAVRWLRRFKHGEIVA